MEQAEKEWLEKRWPQLQVMEIAHKLQKEIFEWEEIVGNEIFGAKIDPIRKSEKRYRRPLEKSL
jgi:hypothetical protein